MEQKGELISYRPDIKVVDCTIRDGGLVNNFYFDDEFVRNLYTANVAAGVEYMEFGYKASKEIFDVKEFGKWKFCDEQDIRDIVGDNNTDLKISVMADVGRTDYKKDIIPKTDIAGRAHCAGWKPFCRIETCDGRLGYKRNRRHQQHRTGEYRAKNGCLPVTQNA